jgi:ABC-2 type transport system ATP-binding protein
LRRFRDSGPARLLGGKEGKKWRLGNVEFVNFPGFGNIRLELFRGSGVNLMMSEPILEARSLSKRYGAVTAVRDISFSIRPGETLGVLGPNGSGKSTIVKMITGLVDPSRGHVLSRGERIEVDPSRYKRSFGYVPEQPDLYGFLTGWEYLDLVATLREIPPRIFCDKAAAMLEGFSLYPHRDSPIASYSKGMRQRIVLIAALMHDPELLVLDEPFSGLDVTTALVTRLVIELLAAKGKAVFFSSPVLEQVEKMCTHLVVLKRGSVVAAGPIGEMQAGFAGQSLEEGFMQLTEQVDAGRIAADIAAAALAPAR